MIQQISCPPLLWIQIHYIKIQVQKFAPLWIWIRTFSHSYIINLEKYLKHIFYNLFFEYNLLINDTKIMAYKKDLNQDG